MKTNNSKEINNRFDYICHFLVRDLNLESYSGEEPRDIQIVLVVMNGVLRLIRSAIENSSAADACAFFTQMFKSVAHPEYRASASEDTQIKRALRFGVILAAGWCVRAVGKEGQGPKPGSKNAAIDVFNECVRHTHGLDDLIELWEEEREQRGTLTTSISALTTRMRVEDWDDTHTRHIRPGFTASFSPDTSWVLDGLMALMLRQIPGRHLRRTDARPEGNGVWPEQPWDIAQIHERLERLAKLDWLMKDAGDARAAIERVETRLNERAKASLVRRIEIIVNNPISISMLDKLSADIGKHIETLEAKNLIGGLRELSVAKPELIRVTPPPYAVRWTLDKQDFNPNVPQASGLAEIIADDVVRRAVIQVFGFAEDLGVARSAALTDLAALGSMIEAATTELRGAGFSPNLIVVPRDDGYRQAIFGLRYWEAPQGRRLGPFHMGQWQGLEVFYWPYVDPRSVMVADTRMLFAEVKHQSIRSRFKSALQSANTDVHDQILKAAQKAVTVADIPDTRTIKVLVDFSLSAAIGIGDPAAARRIKLSPPLGNANDAART